MSINLDKRVILLDEEGQYQVPFSRRRYQEIRKKWIKKGDS